MNDISRTVAIGKISTLISVGLSMVIFDSVSEVISGHLWTAFTPTFANPQWRAIVFMALLVTCTIAAEFLAQRALFKPPGIEDSTVREETQAKAAKHLVHAILYAAAFVTAALLYAAIRGLDVSRELVPYAKALPQFFAYTPIAFFAQWFYASILSRTLTKNARRKATGIPESI